MNCSPDALPINYPYFKWPDAYNHYLFHGKFIHKRVYCSRNETHDGEIHKKQQQQNQFNTITTCNLCSAILDGKQEVHDVVTKHMIQVPLVEILLRHCIETFSTQCAGSNSPILQKGQLSRDQCLQILNDWDEENVENIQTNKDYILSCKNKMTILVKKHMPGCEKFLHLLKDMPVSYTHLTLPTKA